MSDVFTNGANVGNFPGRYTALGTNVWPSVDPTGGVLTAAFQRKPQLSAIATNVGGPSTTGGTIGLSATEVFPNGQVTCTMTAATAYVVSALWTNGALAVTFGGQARTACYTFSNLWADLNVTAVFTYTASLSVTNDYATIPDALAAALTGDTVVVNSGTYTNDVTIGRSVTLQGTNVTVAGSLTIQGGATGTLAGCQGLVVTGATTVANGATLVVSNGTVDAGTLTVQAGGTVQVVNATALVVDGATLTGTFTLDSGWGATVVPQAPPVIESFERYAVGTKLNRMGYFGWAASSDGVVVQTNQAQSGRAVIVPAEASLSSSIASAPATNVWIECSYQDTARIPDDTLTTLDVDTNTTVTLFVMTNGYVTVYNPDLNGVGGWDICSNDAWGAAAPKAGDWPRITINRNLGRGRAAVFLDGRLLRQELRVANVNPGASFHVELDAGGVLPVYFDTYSVNTNAAGIVSADTDQDGWPDAWEIDRFGNVGQSPAGTVFKFR